jgi:serine/threonine protein kinase
MSDPVARLNAALEGRYAIERELGEGGMAKVYLADDLKHERKVDRLVVPQLVGVATAPEGAAPASERFVVVVNWFEELRQRLGN